MAILSEQDPADGGRPARRRRAGLAVAALVVLAAGLGAWLLLRHEPSTRTGAIRKGRRSGERQTTRPTRAAPSGSFEIETSPEGGRVFVDGRDLGRAPQALELSAGGHQVRVTLQGYEPFTRDLHVVPGRTLRLSAELERESPRLRVDSDVAGATVFLDQRPIGTTPLAPRAVSRGSHRVNVTAEGYEMFSETIDFDSDTHELVVRFKEVRLQEAVDVVHQHALGSCRGRLRATVEGLRYETEEASHGFRAPFRDLEPLRTDYLRKNLRVRIRGGNTWNFTGDSADALLSFEKAVESARKRL